MSARNTDEIESRIEFERLFVDDLLNRLTRIENAWRLRIEDVLFGGDGSWKFGRVKGVDVFWGFGLRGEWPQVVKEVMRVVRFWRDSRVWGV